MALLLPHIRVALAAADLNAVAAVAAAERLLKKLSAVAVEAEAVSPGRRGTQRCREVRGGAVWSRLGRSARPFVDLGVVQPPFSRVNPCGGLNPGRPGSACSHKPCFLSHSACSNQDAFVCS